MRSVHRMPVIHRLACQGVLALTLVCAGLLGQPAQASSWDQVGRYLRLLRRMNVEALVAKDCPAGLLGAFHEGRRTLLLCGNNLPDDPKVVWVVLAHESVHVMQFCHGGPLMPANLFTHSLDQARHQDPGLFKELKLYHASQHQLEAEARLVQVLPPDQVEALLWRHCGDQIQP